MHQKALVVLRAVVIEFHGGGRHSHVAKFTHVNRLMVTTAHSLRNDWPQSKQPTMDVLKTGSITKPITLNIFITGRQGGFEHTDQLKVLAQVQPSSLMQSLGNLHG